MFACGGRGDCGDFGDLGELLSESYAELGMTTLNFYYIFF